MVRPITAWLGNAHAFRLLLGLHLLLLAMLFAKHGRADDKEALNYLGAAKDMLQWYTEELLVRYRLYSGHVFFLMPFAAVGMPKAPSTGHPARCHRVGSQQEHSKRASIPIGRHGPLRHPEDVLGKVRARTDHP